ncbi:putative xyloglucan-specific endo-beta-1,4-glucanase A [Cercospora beticola]|uniref:Putative xyloglucan-specific endo-beta-1,4-glucanase A n=1 Tax=Cercospora beticola TaxID=122368 RepID=A0A2G5I579_CERBT|nr:putative xyloglucan-specific endo-beta-1,4-glucanase A [Cercospora beticola]PIA99940.1 putative xyloglucan-specific endo-beta-1,4-glucanase A [Cercospora beticola]WPA99387.1 hypothetical protein RHO25_004004 [Cercospora beticola]
MLYSVATAFVIFASLSAASPALRQDLPSVNEAGNHIAARNDDSRLSTDAASDTLNTNAACDDFGKIQAAGYTLENNIWGRRKGVTLVGSQCVNVNSIKGNQVAWTADFAWDRGDGGVKSFPNLQLNRNPIQLGKITNMRTTFNWDLYCNPKSDIGASIVYDLFAGPQPDVNKKTNEIMVWTGAQGGNGPLSYSYNPYVAIRQNIEVPGVRGRWDLYKGPNSGTVVHSFVATNGRGTGKQNWVERKQWTGNLVNFIKYLIQQKEIRADYWLVQSQAGTELTYGGKNPAQSRSCKFAVSQFDLEVS